jgi:basic membrane protein A
VIAAAVLSLGAVASGGGQGSPLRVGFVFQSASVGRTSDPVEYGAYVGLRKAVEELGVVGKGVAPSPSETFLPAISYLARKHFDLIIALGFLEARDLAVAARRFPDRKFAILDVRWQALEGKPTNVEGTWFKTEQAGYLAGYLAALMEKRRPGRHVISSVGGYSVPQVNAYIAGYQAGAKRADPHVVTLNGYSNDSSIRVSVSGLR